MIMQIIGAMCSKVPLISNAVMKATGCGELSTLSSALLLSRVIDAVKFLLCDLVFEEFDDLTIWKFVQSNQCELSLTC